MFWESVLKLLSFTGVKDVTVWQDVFISALLIPIIILLGIKILAWWNSTRPSRLLFKSCLNEDKNIFVFHSQMSGADNNHNFNPNQKYITRFPDPLPSDHSNLGIQKKINIDPVSSKAEIECLTDAYSVLGRTGKVKNINIGDLINDWNIWSTPIFSIGFNPKTHKLMEKCSPIYFELINNRILKVKNYNINYDAISPNDAGIIQKTFIENTNIPIFILAGLGTMGTSVTGYILKENFTEIGKLFGDSPFCIFIKVKINEGRTSAVIDKIFPTPSWQRIILYPLTYIRFKKKFIFRK